MVPISELNSNTNFYILAAAIILGGVILTSTLIAPSQVPSQLADPRIISTTASAELEIAPEIAYINIRVNTKDRDSATAQEKNANAVNKIRQILLENGVREEGITTPDYSTYSRYEYAYVKDENNGNTEPVKPLPRNRVEVFHVNSTLKAKVTNIDGISKILPQLATVSEAQVSNIQYDIENAKAYKQEVIKMATNKAMENIKHTAQALSVTLKNVHQSDITYSGLNNYSPYPIYWMDKRTDNAAEMEQPINPEKLVIKASINLSYEIK